MAKHNLHIGPLEISPKIAAGVFVVLVGAIVAGVYVVPKYLAAKKAEEEAAAKAAQEAAYDQRVYSLSQITGGKYYVKEGEQFYPVAQGSLYSTKQNDTPIAAAADPLNRMAFFGKDDVLIPTMYSDSALIFKAQDGETLPSEFILERFSDEGWSIGVRGLSQGSGGILKVMVDGNTIFSQSTASAIEVQPGSELVFDKIDGLPFGMDILTTTGTIKNLDKDRTYKIDAYVGTNYVGRDMVADTHVFISMERYALTEYTMDPAGYMIVSFPHDMWSGYYYINGLGMFRYINQPRSMGDTVSNYNTPYFVKDANGNDIINPAAGYGSTGSADSSWDYTFPVTKDTSLLKAKVTYSGSAASGKPVAKLVGPKGGTYTFSEDAAQENTFTFRTEFPEIRTWKIVLEGMSGRVFDVDISYGEPVSGMLEMKKTDDSQISADIILPDINDAAFTFTWDNMDYAGTFQVIGSTGLTFGNRKTPEYIEANEYGKVVLHVGPVPAGNYTIYAEGKALGNIAVSYEDRKPEAPEMPEETKSSDENVEENKEETSDSEVTEETEEADTKTESIVEDDEISETEMTEETTAEGNS